VNDVTWSGDGVYLSVACEDGVVKVWDVNAEAFVTSFASAADEAATSVSSSPQSNIIAVGHYSGTVNTWDGRLPPSKKIRQYAKLHDGPVTSVKYDPDGTVFVTSGMDGLAIVVDTLTGVNLLKLLGSPDQGLCFATFSPNGRFLLMRSLDEDGIVTLWDIHETAKVHRSRRYSRKANRSNDKGIQHWMNCCFVGDLIVSGFSDGTVVAWDSNRSEPLGEAQITKPITEPLAVAGSIDGGWLACGGIGSNTPMICRLE